MLIHYQEEDRKLHKLENLKQWKVNNIWINYFLLHNNSYYSAKSHNKDNGSKNKNKTLYRRSKNSPKPNPPTNNYNFNSTSMKTSIINNTKISFTKNTKINFKNNTKINILNNHILPKHPNLPLNLTTRLSITNFFKNRRRLTIRHLKSMWLSFVRKFRQSKCLANRNVSSWGRRLSWWRHKFGIWMSRVFRSSFLLNQWE